MNAFVAALLAILSAGGLQIEPLEPDPLDPSPSARVVRDHGEDWDAWEAYLESPPREERPGLGSFAWGGRR